MKIDIDQNNKPKEAKRLAKKQWIYLNENEWKECTKEQNEVCEKYWLDILF